jgi:hypothetical protein
MAPPLQFLPRIMWKVFRLAPVALLAAALPAAAQSWSLGLGTGPFIFGKFARRTQTLTNGETTATTSSTLSAATRAGLSADIGRDFNGWLGLRVGASWTEAPMRLKSTTGDNGVNIDAGKMRITTFTAPFVVSLNRHGAFRFDLLGGPAYAMYEIRRTTDTGASAPAFEGTRGRWGFVGGAAVNWWFSDRFAAEGKIEDIVTSSPFEKTDFASTTGLRILRPQNVHTTVGLRLRF